MSIFIRQLNPGACKSYLLGNEGSSQVVVVDPVLEEVGAYLRLLKDENFTLTHVIDTHTHADHISGGPALKDRTDCRYVMHQKAPAQCVTERVTDGQEMLLSGIPITFLHTPGHTKDSLSLCAEGSLFTGDALFLDEGGAGRDDLPGGDPGEHWESLEKLKKLPNEWVVYPAHDYRGRKPSSLGNQKQKNPHLQHPLKKEFIQYLEDLKLGPADWMKDVLKANYACARDPKAAWIPVDSPACEVKGTLEPGVNEMPVKSISVAAFKEKLGASEKPVLLDVREKEELSGPLGQLAGVLNIPIGSLSHRILELEKFKDQEIVIVCRSGGRAFTAAQILTKEKFPKVYVLEGGMQEWRKNNPSSSP